MVTVDLYIQLHHTGTIYQNISDQLGTSLLKTHFFRLAQSTSKCSKA